ncbi:hypothetical protein [Streptomyces sp. H27-H5]|uniref:hypothetical protein n=1 Tax=Streptomyces sp. H27-H5 TaxID=2996460 RepID=UPI00226D6EEA|nr:hypothetical protein [Streptomyces sp. H27-H5]MCY0963465.1 hypothetical protein [Streptomyces sp. H27-H5]
MSTVAAVKVDPADHGLPGDSPIRVWRKVTAEVNVAGYTTYHETTVLNLELMLSNAGEWRVSRILGL